MADQLRIPGSVFDDLLRLADSLLARPMCACFFAVEAALPTSVARQHLEFVRDRAKIVRIDIKQYMERNALWTHSVLPSRAERERVLTSEGDLGVYVALPVALDSRALSNQLRQTVIELSLMIWLHQRILYGENERLHLLFQRAVHVLRAGIRNPRPGEHDPVGSLYLRPEFAQFVSKETGDYANGVRAGTLGFERFSALDTTQLRVLFHLALAVRASGAWSPTDLHESTYEDRERLIQNFGELLQQGLLSPARQRSAKVIALVGDLEIAGYAPSPFDDGYGPWLEWMKARGQESSVGFRARMLGELPERFEAAAVKRQVDEFKLEAQEPLVLEYRRWHAFQHDRHAF